MRSNSISRQTMRRLPLYLEYLNTLKDENCVTISANDIAAALGLGEVQVRKDLAEVTMAGRPKVGYYVVELRRDLRKFLAGEGQLAVLVGAGRLGSALLGYEGFADCGLTIAAAFDSDAARIGTYIGGVPVLDVREMTEFCRQNGVRLGILAAPAEAAQDCLDALVEGGVKAVWSFVPMHLRAPEDVLVQRENFSGTLAILTQHLMQN